MEPAPAGNTLRNFFKHQKDGTPRQHVTKEAKEDETMLRMQMKEYTKVELETIDNELRQFDLNMKYGPVSGLSRTQRWQRAHDLNLNPPSEIKVYLEDESLRQQMPNLDKHLWCGVIDMDLNN